MASSTLLLMVMTACVTVHAVTERAKLESWNYAYYARNWAHVGSVTAMDLVQVHSASPMPDCRANATFGFYGSTTWVSGGCRGDFDVSFDDTDTMEQKFDQLTQDVHDGAANSVNLTLEVEAQSKVIAELRCAVAKLDEDDPWNECCVCPVGWTEYHPDGKLMCYRQATTNDEELHHAEAKALCKDLHPRSVLPMPKTEAQLRVLKSYQFELPNSDWDHIGIDIDASGNLQWHDGSAGVLPADQYNGEAKTNVEDAPCGDGYEFEWGNYYSAFNCYGEGNQHHGDGDQLCQLEFADHCDEE